MRKKSMIGEKLALDFGFDIVRLDWQPIERHPRPFRRKNPNDFGRSAFKFCVSLSHMLFELADRGLSIKRSVYQLVPQVS